MLPLCFPSTADLHRNLGPMFAKSKYYFFALPFSRLVYNCALWDIKHDFERMLITSAHLALWKQDRPDIVEVTATNVPTVEQIATQQSVGRLGKHDLDDQQIKNQSIWRKPLEDRAIQRDLVEWYYMTQAYETFLWNRYMKRENNDWDALSARNDLIVHHNLGGSSSPQLANRFVTTRLYISLYDRWYELEEPPRIVAVPRQQGDPPAPTVIEFKLYDPKTRERGQLRVAHNELYMFRVAKFPYSYTFTLYLVGRQTYIYILFPLQTQLAANFDFPIIGQWLASGGALVDVSLVADELDHVHNGHLSELRLALFRQVFDPQYGIDCNNPPPVWPQYFMSFDDYSLFYGGQVVSSLVDEWQSSMATADSKLLALKMVDKMAVLVAFNALNIRHDYWDRWYDQNQQLQDNMQRRAVYWRWVRNFVQPWLGITHWPL